MSTCPALPGKAFFERSHIMSRCVNSDYLSSFSLYSTKQFCMFIGIVREIMTFDFKICQNLQIWLQKLKISYINRQQYNK